jgi:hypothetical protein
MTRHKVILYQMTLPVLVQLRDNADNALLVAERTDVTLPLTEEAITQHQAQAREKQMSYEAAVMAYLREHAQEQIVRQGNGRLRARLTREYPYHFDIYAAITLAGKITYTRVSHL